MANASFPYRGPYVLELASGAPRHILPKAVNLEGEFVSITMGRVVEEEKGFLFQVEGLVSAPHRTGGEFTYTKDEVVAISIPVKVLWRHD